MTLEMMLICQKTFVTPMSQSQQIIDHHRAAVALSAQAPWLTRTCSFACLRCITPPMTVVSQVQHPRSLDFANQRRAYLLRRDEKLAYSDIAKRVVNLMGKPSTADTVLRAVKRFNTKKGMSTYKYSRCGRQAWKLTPEVKTWLVQQLLALRRTCVCTSTTLQKALADTWKIKASDSAIRKVLKAKGYRWLQRAQKCKYSREDKKTRLAFANRVVRMGARQLKEDLAMAMDGVVLAMPPADPIDRENHCKHGETHMWRKPSEAASPDLAGEDSYAKQIPMGRAVPLWGGISAHGVAEILVHKTKKCQVDEWVAAVTHGKMMAALRKLRPHKLTRPWRILCDNEHFLTARPSKEAYEAKGIHLWQIPPRSPDLNPIEKFWGWLRRELRRRDLKDWEAKRPALGRTAYRARLRAVLRTKKTQAVAARYAGNLMTVCKLVQKNKGAHSGK